MEKIEMRKSDLKSVTFTVIDDEAQFQTTLNEVKNEIEKALKVKEAR